MSLAKLAIELEETSRQTAEMVDRVNDGLAVLMDDATGCKVAREEAIRKIIVGLQMQDRIQQRCDNMAGAARRMAEMVEVADRVEAEDVWAGLTLDELRKPNLSGVAQRNSDDIELF